MQFNSEANGLDLYSDCRYLCGLDETADTTSYPIKAFTRNANIGLDRVVALILRADNLWMFDDSNQTGELLDISNNLVSGTNKYAMVVTWLKIGRVRIKDANGNWITLKPAQGRKELNDTMLTAPNGTPQYYYLMGGFLYFDKAPNYNSTGGLEVQFQRGASYFANTDTTKVPGFASHFHPLISMYAAIRYCKINGMTERVADIQSDIDKLEGELILHYAGRDTDAKISMKPIREDYGQLGLSPGNGPGNINPRGFY